MYTYLLKWIIYILITENYFISTAFYNVDLQGFKESFKVSKKKAGLINSLLESIKVPLKWNNFPGWYIPRYFSCQFSAWNVLSSHTLRFTCLLSFEVLTNNMHGCLPIYYRQKLSSFAELRNGYTHYGNNTAKNVPLPYPLGSTYKRTHIPPWQFILLIKMGLESK